MIVLAASNPPVIVQFLLGVLVTLLAWAALHFNQRRVKRDRYRRALLHEINYIADESQRLLDAVNDQSLEAADVDRAVIALGTDIINSNVQRLSMLTTPEISAVYDFYESVRLLHEQLDRYRTDDAEFDHERFREHAEETITRREVVDDRIKRSRLSLFTEWYKQRDRDRRNRP